MPRLSLGTLPAAWRAARGSHRPPAGAGAGGAGLRGGRSEKKFHSIAHSRHRTYPEAERDASSLRLQGLGERGGRGGRWPPPLSSSHDCARSRVCGAPARGAPPAAQLCTKAAWHCLASRARPAPRPLFPVPGRRGSPLSAAAPQPSPFPSAPTRLSGWLAGRAEYSARHPAPPPWRPPLAP